MLTSLQWLVRVSHNNQIPRCLTSVLVSVTTGMVELEAWGVLLISESMYVALYSITTHA